MCDKYRGVIPHGRLMKMRWVLTFKRVEGEPDKAKRKARLVLLGFSDPDLLDSNADSAKPPAHAEPVHSEMLEAQEGRRQECLPSRSGAPGAKEHLYNTCP